MLLRGCLESALYGLYLSHNTTSQETWLRRHVDDASRQKVRSEFTLGRLMEHLESVDQGSHTVARTLYDRTIDYGAHPNEAALTSVLSTKEQDGVTQFDLNHLSGNTPFLHACLKSCSQVGICVLDIFYNVFPERYQLLILDEDIKKAKLGFK